jgi:hypothetical protein
MYLAPAELRQGALQEREGRREAARAHYARALALWQDADAAFAPYVTEARRGLARLSGGDGAPEPGRR